jgi:hypothetical protein
MWFNSTKFNSTWVDSTKFNSTWFDSTKFNSTWFDSTKFNSMWFDSTKFNSRWFDSTKFNSMWFNSTKFNSFEISMRTLILPNVGGKEFCVQFNWIQIQLSWFQFKLHAVMTFNFFIQMKLNFHKNQNSVKTRCRYNVKKNSFKLVIAPGVVSPAVSKGDPSEIKCW